MGPGISHCASTFDITESLTISGVKLCSTTTTYILISTYANHPQKDTYGPLREWDTYYVYIYIYIYEYAYYMYSKYIKYIYIYIFIDEYIYI